jgi:uncharacterized protein
MRQQLPKDIDPYRFCYTKREITGEVELAQLTRLADALENSEGTVNITMQFDVDERGIPFVHGQFETTLSLVCERCLNVMPLPVKIDTKLALIKHEKQADNLTEEYEPWLVDNESPINPLDVVEDELILVLPLVPKHDNDCLPDEVWESKDENATEDEPEKPVSPFAALAALKSKKTD